MNARFRKILVVVVCVAIIAGASTYALYSYTPLFRGANGQTRGATCQVGPSGSYCGGDGSAYFLGWKAPDETMISTSFVINETLTTFVNANVNVFPYFQQNGSLYLGLYVNGYLRATQSYNLTSEWGASVLNVVKNSSSDDQVVEFPAVLAGYEVSFSFIYGKPIASGSVVTVAALSSEPIWFQISNTTTSISSYESTVPPD
jgi:hypothetical protein